MKTSEIKELIMRKNNEVNTLIKRSDDSNDLNEVRSIGETLKNLRDEISELEKQLSSAESETSERSGIPEGAILRNADIVKGHSTPLKEGLALRKDESMVSRVKNANTHLDLGKCIRGMYTGNWEGAEAERREMDTSATGVIIPAVCSGQILDYARNTSLFGAAGVPVYPMTSNNLTLARLSSDPTFSFKAEGEEATESTFDIDSVEL